ncbi:MAG TPA: MMPL family transporter [Gaiellaceae bacterium]
MTRAVSWLVTRLGVVLVPAWIVAAVAAAHWLPGISEGHGTPLGGLVPASATALRVQEHEVRKFGNTLLTPVVVVQHRPTPFSHAQLQQAIVRAELIDRHRVNRFVPLAVAAPVVSPDRTTAVTYLYFPADISPGHQLRVAQRYARTLDPPGLRTGPLLARDEEYSQIQRSLPWVTLATVGLIAIVLLLTFRAIVPPLLVLGTAGIAYTIAVHVLAWLGAERHQQVPKEVEPILVALLLGLVTDYAIFFLAGTRRRLAAGDSRFAAVDDTARHNLPIIVTAGLIVALGSLSLVAGHLAVFRSFGPGMAITVVIALAVATTFIPGLLALLGPLVFWPSLNRVERGPRERFWRGLTARPVSALVALVLAAALVAGCAGLLQLRLGFTLVRGQPPGAEVKRAQEWAQQSFAAGVTQPTEVLIEGRNLRNVDALAAATRLQEAVARVPGVARVLGPLTRPRATRALFVSRDGTTIRFLVVLHEEALDGKAIATLRRLESRMPSLLRSSGLGGATAAYAGDTALAQETVDAVRADGVRVGIVVLLVNLVLLALFLRAIWAPLYLLAASVLALGAALGAMTWIMERVLHHDDVTYYVPFAASVLLLSLGSDYNVFVVGRIWQSARERPLREAIAETAPRTSSTITTAGVTLAGSFAMLALIPLRPMRELALAMAVGILLDTFVVRSLLVPSLLALFSPRRRDTLDE